MSVSAFINYLTIERNYSTNTVEAYKHDLISFEKFLNELNPEENQNIENAQQEDLKKWIIHLTEQNITFKTVNRKLAALRTYFSFLKKSSQIEVSPFEKGIPSLKTEKNIKLPFSEDEVKKVLSLCEDKNCFEAIRNHAIIETLYSTGIRRFELINLQLKDIDFGSHQLKVLGKRNKERLIPMLPELEKSLKEYLFVRQEVANSESENYLFLLKNGKKIYETLVYRIINSYFSTITTKKNVSPHVLRHSFASHLLDGGADLNTVKELLGHSSLASTQVYTNSSLAELKKQYNGAHPRAIKNE